jgi:putative transposase
MPGRKIPLVTGEYYHVFNRGVNKFSIFESTSCYKRCIDQINYYRHQKTPIKYSALIKLNYDIRQSIWDLVLKSNEKQVEIVAFCLMPNHFHFLLKQTIDQGISKFMSKFQNSYTRFYNTKNSRTGPLLTGKFQAVLIESDEQLLHVSRYIHLNPLVGGVVKGFKQLLSYKWSSLPDYYNKPGKSICGSEIVLNQFKSSSSYINFLYKQLAYAKELNYLKHLDT